jgi:RNA polymerase sigma-70 factor (ECF subfamily)
MSAPAIRPDDAAPSGARRPHPGRGAPSESKTPSLPARLDRSSRAWLDSLQSVGFRRDEATRRLHSLLVREARFEIRRRTGSTTHPSGRDLDDLAVQSADDAVVAILAKLDQFRGDSLFTTWARGFAHYEAPAKIRRRLGRGGELPMEDVYERRRLWPVSDQSPHESYVAKERSQLLARLIADDLTQQQREILVALTLEGVTTEDLAARRGTTPGALYKSLHDARAKLRLILGEA